MKGEKAELPEGLIYREEFLSESQERELVQIFGALSFDVFEYKGFTARRRVIAYGWTYDFNTNKLSHAAAIPSFLLPVREAAAQVAGVAAADLEEALITEYCPGAPINWHRDLPMFDTVIGISLLSSCTMRFKPYQKEGKSVPLTLQPRSLYIMRGAARWNFQHSIPPVKELRYSITFRTLRK